MFHSTVERTALYGDEMWSKNEKLRSEITVVDFYSLIRNSYVIENRGRNCVDRAGCYCIGDKKN